MRQLDYITLNHIDDFQFFQLPKRLFREEYSAIPDGAKILYGVLLSRTRLSQKNKWIDEDGHVYIIYPNDELCTELGRSETTISAYKKALADNGLIEIRKNGFNGYIIYVKNINSDNCQHEVPDNCHLEVPDNCQHEVTETCQHEVPENETPKYDIYIKNNKNTDNIECEGDSLTQEQYNNLIAEYGSELVDKTIKRAQKYKNCLNYATIHAWLDEARTRNINEQPPYKRFEQRAYDEWSELELDLLANRPGAIPRGC